MWNFYRPASNPGNDSEQEENEAPKAGGKKGKKDRKKKKDADLEDAQKELEAIAAGVEVEDDAKEEHA